MKRLIPLLFIPVFLFSGVLSRSEADDGWILVHDGESNAGWGPEVGSGWTVSGGSLVMDGTGGGLLKGKLPFGDFQMRLEVKAFDAKSNAGLFLRANRDGAPKDTGYQIQLGGGDAEWPFGSVVGQSKASVALPTGAWVPLEIEANGASITVKSGGRSVASASGLQTAAGVLILEANRGGRLEIRNFRLKLLNTQSLFNGTDLGGWKSTGTQPKQGGGMFSKIFGGGKKPKEVKWTVGGGSIHGADGPGQLEYLAPQGDFLFQAAVRLNGKRDSKKRYALVIRGDAGQLGTGYEVTLQPGSMGGLVPLASPRKATGSVGQYSTVTVAAFNRHFEVWVDGSPVLDLDDSRPEGPNPKKDARSGPGVIAFFSPEEDANIDIRNVHLVALSRAMGHTTKHGVVSGPATPPPAVVPTYTPPTNTAAGGGNGDQVKLLQQQLDQQKAEKQKQEEDKQKISQLLQQALSTPDPQAQVALYDRILAVDPNNQVAFSGRKEAQGKVDAANAQAAKDAEEKAKRDADAMEKEKLVSDSLQKAQTAFLAGNLVDADKALSVAERVAPQNEQVRALRSRVDSARSRFNSTLGIAGLGVGAISLGGLAWFVMARRRKDPFLEIVEGLDKGKKFNLDQEVVAIGAIPEDGGAKNDIVLRDAERMISRFHAQFLYKDGKLYVVDLKSSNGTFVDKQRIPAGKPIPIKGGSRISFGGTVVVKTGFEKRAKGKR